MNYRYKVGDIVVATKRNILGGLNNIGDRFKIQAYASNPKEYVAQFLDPTKRENYIYGYFLREDCIKLFRSEELL